MGNLHVSSGYLLTDAKQSRNVYLACLLLESQIYFDKHLSRPFFVKAVFDIDCGRFASIAPLARTCFTTKFTLFTLTFKWLRVFCIMQIGSVRKP